MENDWLSELLNAMQRDISEIKNDVKALQKSKFMLDGAKELARVVVTVLIALLTMWVSNK